MTEPTMHDVAAAIEAFRPMLSALTGYARAMLGDPAIRVESGPRTMTDGTTIYVRPPLALATLPGHARRECGKRDGVGILSCPACAEREAILVAVRHEIAHIAHGSFEKIMYRKSTLEEIATDAGLPGATIPGSPRRMALMVWASRAPDPMIWTLTMALEDVRIDTLNADGDDDGAAAYRATLTRMASDGHEGQPPLRERPLDLQVLMGLVTVPHGVAPEGLLSPEAIEILGDETVSGILGTRFKGSKSVLPAAYAMYRRLIELGVLAEPEQDEQEQDEQEQEDGEQETGPEEGDGDADGGDQEHDGSGDQDGQQAGQDGDQEGEASGPAFSDPTDLRQALKVATGHDRHLDGEFEPDEDSLAAMVRDAEVTLEHMGDPRPHLGGIKVYGRRRPDGLGPLHGVSRRAETLRAVDPPESVLGALTGRARIVFSDNAAIKRQRDATRGRVSPTTLGKRAWNPDDQRLFERRHRPNAQSYSVLVGMDNSGSTAGGTVATILRETALATAMMCQRVGVEVSVYAHTTGDRLSLDCYEIKAPGDPWTPRIGDDLRNLNIGSTNFDGSTMTLYRRILAARPATQKVLLYFTDGAIPGSGGQTEAQIMRDEVEACKRQGITLLGVGAETLSPEDFGIPTVSLDKQEDVKKVLEFLATEFGM